MTGIDDSRITRVLLPAWKANQKNTTPTPETSEDWIKLLGSNLGYSLLDNPVPVASLQAAILASKTELGKQAKSNA